MQMPLVARKALSVTSPAQAKYNVAAGGVQKNNLRTFLVRVVNLLKSHKLPRYSGKRRTDLFKESTVVQIECHHALRASNFVGKN